MDFYSLKSPFLGFQVIQTGYWPVFNLEGVLYYYKYIYYKKCDQFPSNGGNRCGSAPDSIVITSITNFTFYWLNVINLTSKQRWLAVFPTTIVWCLVFMQLFACKVSFPIALLIACHFSAAFLSTSFFY